MFAAEASLVLTSAGVDVTDEQLSSRRSEALGTRRVIAQAEGVIMEREGVEADDAYSMLCDYSRTSNRPFRERAEDVVASTRRLRLDTGVRTRGKVTMAETSAAERPVDLLDRYRRDAGLSHGDLWLRYFELGGMRRCPRAGGDPLWRHPAERARSRSDRPCPERAVRRTGPEPSRPVLTKRRLQASGQERRDVRAVTSACRSPSKGENTWF